MLLIAFYGKFCSFCKPIMPMFLNQLNHGESKFNSKLQIKNRKKNNTSRMKQSSWNFCKGYEISQPLRNFAGTVPTVFCLFDFFVIFFIFH